MSRIWIPLFLLGVLAPQQANATTPYPPLTASALSFDGPPPPWRARSRKVEQMEPHRQGLIDLNLWPDEPPAPNETNREDFTHAVRRLCRGIGTRRARSYARWILEAAAQFDVDPFTVAAVIYDQTRCKARYRSAYGRGLAALNWRMHRRQVTRKGYRYYIWNAEKAVWDERLLETGRYRFRPDHMRTPHGAITLTAALLHVYQQQCPQIDGAFHSVPHRHPVSHIVWGDRVLDPAYEDNILRARRRLLELYAGSPARRCGVYKGLALQSPVDGLPRKVLSGWGAPRFRGGRRHHKGIDLFGPRGAPVFAVADGEVMFAGASVRRGRRGRSVPMPYAKARRIGRWRLALSGYFVMIRHGSALISAYMHMSAYTVENGQKVKAGQLIGFIGDTGVHRSKPHLHFELREPPRHHLDPLPYFGSCFFPPEATFVGRWRGEYFERVAQARADRRARFLARRAARREARVKRRARGHARRLRQSRAQAQPVKALAPPSPATVAPLLPPVGKASTVQTADQGG